MNRRRFLALSGSIAAYGYLSRFEVCGASSDPTQKIYCALYGSSASAKKRGLLFWLPGKNQTVTIDTPLRLHSIVQNPVKLDQIFVMSKFHKTSGFVDLKTKQMGALVLAGPDFQFYGHACYSSDGKRLYTAEQCVSTGEGYVGIRDGRTGKLISRFKSLGSKPHQCALLDDATFVILNSYGEKGDNGLSNFLTFNLKDQSLLKKVEFKEKQQMTHFFRDSAGWTIFGGFTGGKDIDHGTLPSVLIVSSPQGEQTVFKVPKKYEADWLGECASFAVDEKSGFVAVASYGSKNIYRFDYKKGTFLDAAEGVQSRAVAIESSDQFMSIEERVRTIRHYESKTFKNSGRDEKLQPDLFDIGPHIQAVTLKRGNFI